MQAFVLSRSAAHAIESAEVVVPEPSDGELLVRVHAVGVGIHDTEFLPPGAGLPIGIEGAGIVEAAGRGILDRRPGDRVAFASFLQPKGGTWAEYAVVDANALIVPMPAQMDFIDAAAVPVAGNTALRALAALDDLPEHASIFIAGGAGAIGTLSVQLAHQRIWRVATSASVHNHDYLHRLGADLTVDYRQHDWPSEVLRWMPGGVDAAVAIHPGTSGDAIRVVRDGGRVISISGDTVSGERGIQVMTVPGGADVHRELTRLMTDVTAGRIHLEIEEVFPFADAARALERVRTRHVRGKLVLRVA